MLAAPTVGQGLLVLVLNPLVACRPTRSLVHSSDDQMTNRAVRLIKDRRRLHRMIEVTSRIVPLGRTLEDRRLFWTRARLCLG